MVLGIAHIAIAVRSIDDALKLWRDALGLRLKGIEEVPSEKIRAAFLFPDGGKGEKIELIEPTDKESPVARFIEKKGSGGIHHIAFLVSDLERETKRLVSEGYRMAGPPRMGAGGTRVSFVHPGSCDGTLIEFVEGKP